MGGPLFLPATPDVIAGFIAAAQAAPEELSTIVNVMPAPPLPFVPAEHHGRLVVMALMAYAGPVEDGERALAPFRDLATPIADMVGPMPYPELYPPEDESYHPVAAIRTMFLDGIDRQAAGSIVEGLEAGTAPMRVTQLRVLGGAMARVPADATAFAHRGSPIMANVVAIYERPEERSVHEDWIAGPGGGAEAGATTAPTSASSATRVRSASAPPIRGGPGTGWRRSRPATTRTTSSGSTRTSRRRLPGGQQPDAQPPRQALAAPAHHHVVVVVEHRPRDR